VRRSLRAALGHGRGFGVAALVVALALALIAPPVSGARGLDTGFMDSLFGSTSASTRSAWLNKAKGEGATIVRQNVNWAGVTSRKPIAPTNPADPAYHFGPVDNAVKSASAQGMKVLLTAYDAPPWAEGKHRPSNAPAGTWKPSPKALGQFAQALAKRYSGKFLTLPRVRYFQAWNEPNLEQYLSPQWHGKKPASPGIYRNLLNSFYSGVKKSQRSGVVVTGGTAPYGDPM
jgi:Cellulase (glycosyl hydrolase family 5)